MVEHIRRVVLVIGGGVAAPKALGLIRLLRGRGIDVVPVLSRGGREFVTEIAVAGLADGPVYHDLYATDAPMRHIALSRESDLVVVAPCSANMMARLAGGMADDLATAVILASDKPVMIVPAMNHRMWSHPATVANLECLRARGVRVVEPVEGPMACNEYGVGRMPEPEVIAEAIAREVGVGVALGGRRVLVTAGATREPIDAARYLGNYSSGRQGIEIARSLRDAGAEVVLILGHTEIPPPTGVEVIAASSAESMLAAGLAALPADALVAVAAVADWRAEPHADKLRKSDHADGLVLRLHQTVDVLATICGHQLRPGLVVGFSAESQEVVAQARSKRLRKGCDWMVANNLSAMGSDSNVAVLITDDGEISLPPASKAELARALVARIADALA